MESTITPPQTLTLIEANKKAVELNILQEGKGLHNVSLEVRGQAIELLKKHGYLVADESTKETLM